MKSSQTQGNTAYVNLDTVPDPNEDLEANLYYLDLETGEVHERETTEDEGDTDGSWQSIGTLPQPTTFGDAAPPAAITGLTVTPVNRQSADGNDTPMLEVTWTEGSETDLIGYEVQIAEGSGPTWGNPITLYAGLSSTPGITVTDNLLAATLYSVRVRANDFEGFNGAWSGVVEETTLGDTTAPEVPDDVSVSPGYKLLGIHWAPALETPDFSEFEVRFYVTSEGVTEASTLRTKSNRIIVKDLLPDTEYTVQVQAYDRSGNASGWSIASTGTPVLIGAEDLAVDTIIANFISSGELSADVLTGGTLKVGGSGQPGSLNVYNAGGTLIASLDNDGLVMVNANNSSQAMWLKAGSLKFTEAYDGSVDTTEWTTGITPEGINAEAITFGTFLGGANSIPNAGFELAPFVTPTEAQYPNSPWSTTSYNAVNMTVSTGTFTMTAS